MDIRIDKTRNIITRMSRKPYKTYNYLKAYSFHPGYQKKCVVKGILNRVWKLSSPAFRWTDMLFFHSKLRANGYDDKFIKTCWKDVKEMQNTRSTKTRYIKLPYLGRRTEYLRKSLFNTDIGITLVGGNNVKNILPSLYTKKDSRDRAGVIYQIPCECNTIYTGETGRKFRIRENEHRMAILRDDTRTSTLADHCYTHSHWPNFDQSKIVGTGSTKYVRRLKEDIFRLKQGENSINKNRPITLQGDVRDLVAVGRLTTI